MFARDSDTKKREGRLLLINNKLCENGRPHRVGTLDCRTVAVDRMGALVETGASEADLGRTRTRRILRYEGETGS